MSKSKGKFIDGWLLNYGEKSVAKDAMFWAPHLRISLERAKEKNIIADKEYKLLIELSRSDSHETVYLAMIIFIEKMNYTFNDMLSEWTELILYRENRKV